MSAKPQEKQVVPAAPAAGAVVNWEDQLKQMAIATAEAERPGGNWVSFKGGILTINGTQMKDNRVEAIVLHSIFENQFYAERYNPNNPQPPVCYAFGETDDDLRPHPDAAKPQADSCATCAKNAWGSDPEGGKGKACKNVRRLGIIAAPDASNPETIKKAEVAIAKLPVTSVKNWATYANQVANALHLPPLAVVTEMSVEPDPKWQFQVNFRLIDKVNGAEIIQALLKKRGEIHDLMFAKYEKPVEVPAVGPRKY